MKFQVNNIKNIIFSKIFLVAFCGTFFMVSLASRAQSKKYVVVLDAGHGGADPGNIGNGYYEKNIALKVVKNIGKELSKSKDIEVVYTRDKDILVDLWKRGEIANKAKADLFVSIHCDAHTSSAYGAGTFVLGLHANKRNFEVAKRENAVISLEKDYKQRYKGFDPNSEESVIGLTLLQEENLDKSFLIASGIQKNIVKLKRRDRGVKQAGFVVLYQTYMPSVLVELGFLTNKKEGRYLNSKRGQQEMSVQISKAIKSYLNRLKANTISVEDITIQDITIQDKIETRDKKKSNDVLFKVQIASSRKKISTKSYNFKGLKDVERVKVGSYYKYYYGNTDDYKQVKESLKIAKSKGYTSAFVTAFKNGEKVSVKDALK